MHLRQINPFPSVRTVFSFRQARSRIRGFTLIEIMVALGALLILGSIAVYAYQKLLDDAREAVCETNVKALTTAVELYTNEYGVVPAVLGDLKMRHLEKAYAQVMKNSDWHTRFAHKFLEMSLSNEAYAQFLTYKNLRRFGVSKKMLRCPEDDNGGVSYGINGNLAGRRWAKLRSNVIVVGDCDSPVFFHESDLKRRHHGGKVAVAASKAKKIRKRILGVTSAVDPCDPDENDELDNDDNTMEDGGGMDGGGMDGGNMDGGGGS